METKIFTNIQNFMHFLNYAKENVWIKHNKAYNVSKQKIAELIINNKDNENLYKRENKQSADRTCKDKV